MSNEFSLIDAFLAQFPRAPVRVGPGDDCAVVRPGPGDLCVTTDAVVEGVHFTRPAFAPEEIGHKALAVNLSDLASMGAAPRWFLCAIAAPPALRRTELTRLGRGMATLAREHKIWLVGGNLSRAGELSVTIAAAGELRGPPLTRSGARPGDHLYVSGTLGEARWGLLQLRSGKRRSAAIERQKRPAPRVRLGGIAARFASACIDVSDGLSQDLGHLCAASRVGVEVDLGRVPVTPGVRAGMGPLRALAGGEDYELLLAVPRARSVAFERACERAGERVTRIGRFRRSLERVVIDPTGRARRPPAGFDHFRAGRR